MSRSPALDPSEEQLLSDVESGAMHSVATGELLSQLQQAGFSQARMHHIASWKHGVLGSDLPGVLVIEAER